VPRRNRFHPILIVLTDDRWTTDHLTPPAHEIGACIVVTYNVVWLIAGVRNGEKTIVNNGHIMRERSTQHDQ
jgi:uncharacterized protein YegL